MTRSSQLLKRHKLAYDKVFSVIEKVYVRRNKGREGKSSASSPLAVTGHIGAKKKTTRSPATIRALRKSNVIIPESTDGLRRSPRIMCLLDGHKASAPSSAHPSKGPSTLSKSSL
jgi:hypothetical protein